MLPQQVRKPGPVVRIAIEVGVQGFCGWTRTIGCHKHLLLLPAMALFIPSPPRTTVLHMQSMPACYRCRKFLESWSWSKFRVESTPQLLSLWCQQRDCINPAFRLSLLAGMQLHFLILSQSFCHDIELVDILYYSIFSWPCPFIL